MRNKISVYIQYILPQHLLTRFMGWLAQIRQTKLKNSMIERFIKKYQVDMSAAIVENPREYPTFNDFFIRKLKPELRPITSGLKDIASPVDGAIAQIGKIHKRQLLQAKNFYFDLESLFGGDSELASTFEDGNFATLYLAPKDYHRIHMPLEGKLLKSIYIPGKLFSVNRMTSELIPNIYSRNERLITIFETAAGRMAVILVGAIIVGSIQTVWMNQPVRNNQSHELPQNLILETGAELGLFKLGSTVVLLFEKDRVEWQNRFTSDTLIQFGSKIGHIY